MVGASRRRRMTRLCPRSSADDRGDPHRNPGDDADVGDDRQADADPAVGLPVSVSGSAGDSGSAAACCFGSTVGRWRRTLARMGRGVTAGDATQAPAPRVPGAGDAKSVSEVVEVGLTSRSGAVGRRSAKAAAHTADPHPTVAQRQREGRLARVESPREQLSVWKPAADRADPVALLAGQETTRVQELVPVRHARMAATRVHLLPGGCAGDGRGPCEPASQRPGRAAVRRCASVQLRPVRRPGPLGDLRRQRLRRDQSRPVRVGRQAAGHLLRAGRPGQRAARQGRPGRRRGGRRVLPPVHGRLRREAGDRDLVRPHRRRPAGRGRAGVPERQGQARGQAEGEGGGDDPGGRGEGSTARRLVGDREDHRSRGRDDGGSATSRRC